jgi:addiction module HigA family antidote
MTFERRSGAGWSVHPGEILQHEFLKPMDLSGYALAKALGINPQRVSDITLKKTGLSAEMAVMLAKFFGTTPEFWMNLQAAYELTQAQKTLKKKLEKIKPVKASAA